MDIDPDGRLLGFTAMQEANGTLRPAIGLLAVGSGDIEALPDIPLTPHPYLPGAALPVRPAPGGGVAFVKVEGCTANVWVKPVRGGPQTLTHLNGELIFDFASSKTGRLAIARGRVQHDVVLVTRQ